MKNWTKYGAPISDQNEVQALLNNSLVQNQEVKVEEPNGVADQIPEAVQQIEN